MITAASLLGDADGNAELRERLTAVWHPGRLKYFIALGCASILMYLHQSPGLLRLKQKAGL